MVGEASLPGFAGTKEPLLSYGELTSHQDEGENKPLSKLPTSGILLQQYKMG